MKQRYQALRGTRDILPDESPRWQFLEAVTRDVFARYGFDEIRTPIFESTELFTRSVGQSTDIVRKEMYTFQPGDESMTLRPENTAPVVRAVIEHSLHRQVAAGFPERYFYIGPMFRHERPQKGRQRQFHQVGVEVLGGAEALVDAETLQMIDAYLGALGINDRELLLSSVGDAACRPAYRDALREWLAPRLESLCDDCKRRFDDNPLRVFDCKVEADRAQLAGAPTMADHLCADCDVHFRQVRKYLDDYGIRYTLDPRLVRGLDYYQRTVFEVVATGLGAQNAVLGGGRYDGLVKELGGPDLPGFGFAMGIERAILLMPADRGRPRPVDLALIGLGAVGFGATVGLARRLRAAGLVVMAPLVERALAQQLKRAGRAEARFAVFVGQDEIARGRYGVKDLESGEQAELDEHQIVERARETDG